MATACFIGLGSPAWKRVGSPGQVGKKRHNLVATTLWEPTAELPNVIAAWYLAIFTAFVAVPGMFSPLMDSAFPYRSPSVGERPTSRV